MVKTTSETAAASLVLVLAASMQDMSAWWEGFKTQQNDLVTEDSNGCDIVLPKGTDSISDASVLLYTSLFWLLCHKMAWRLACKASLEPNMAALLHMRSLEERARNAVAILRAVVFYCTQHEQGLVGLLCLKWPLQVAAQFCQRLDEKRAVLMAESLLPTIGVERQLGTVPRSPPA